MFDDILGEAPKEDNTEYAEQLEMLKEFEYRCPICGKNLREEDRGKILINDHQDKFRREIYYCESCEKEYIAKYKLESLEEISVP